MAMTLFEEEIFLEKRFLCSDTNANPAFTDFIHGSFLIGGSGPGLGRRGCGNGSQSGPCIVDDTRLGPLLRIVNPKWEQVRA
jgi:hypothetical protein